MTGEIIPGGKAAVGVVCLVVDSCMRCLIVNSTIKDAMSNIMIIDHKHYNM